MSDVIRSTVAKELRKAAVRSPHEGGFVFPVEGTRLDFPLLEQRTDDTAKALLGLGLEKGSHIGIWSVNTSRWLILALSAAKVGIVFVPLNTSYQFRELSDIVQRADIDCLFVMDTLRGSDCWETSQQFLKDGAPDRDRFPHLRDVVVMADNSAGGHHSWQSFQNGAAAVSDQQLKTAEALVTSSDDYIIQYTSGTTARPKGVVLTQLAVLSSARSFGTVMHLGPDDVTCVPLPLFHCYGNVLTLLSGVLYGSTTVYLDYFRPGDALATLAQERCTAFMGVPAMHLAMIGHADFHHYDLSRLRKGGIGGSTCPPAMMETIACRMGMDQLVVGYGLSEAASLCLISDITDSFEHRLHTMGFPVPGLEVIVQDPQTGTEVPRGMGGEILVRGHGVMKGYYNAPAETTAALDDDGWLHTGDLGMQNPDGSFKFLGRIKDIIIRSGENISPGEIEELLLEWENVHDCQCVGVPDPIRGEEIACCLISQDGAEFPPSAVRDYVSARLAHYKVPRYVLTMESYPLNASGKVMRDELARIAIKTLAQDPAHLRSPATH